MRTLAVLAALAAVATAVPALHGTGYNQGYRPVKYRLPANFRREKKSPQTLTDPAPVEVAIDTSPDVTPELSARTIALKKPIIIKKKLGYHLYRDSDEEQAHADPREKCNKEVKVKLCDAEHMTRSSDNMRAAEETELTENDMETSIKLAKEAVENLQKMTKFQSARLGAEDEVHEDIEIARQALEHIQQNFGNLESMKVHAATLSEAEALNNARFTIANTESEKMAQWKEAINNIQKNAEIAKNIEDSFKSTNLMSGAVIEDSEQTQTAKSSESDKNERLESLSQVKSSDEKIDDKLEATIKNAESLEMMTSAAFELKESKVEDNSGNTNEKSELNKEASNDEESETKKIMKSDADMNKQPKVVENMELDQAPAASAPLITSVSFTKDDEIRAVQQQWTNEAKDSEGEKTALKETDISEILAKSSEHISEPANKEMDPTEMNHEKASEVDTTSLMKSSESDTLNKVDEVNVKEKNSEQSIKPTVNKPNEHMGTPKTDDSLKMKSAKDETFPPFFKAAENKEVGVSVKSAELSSVNQKLTSNLQNSLEAQPKEQNAVMKSAQMEVSVGEQKEAQMKSALMEASASEHMEVSSNGQQSADLTPLFKSVDKNELVDEMKSADDAPVEAHNDLEGPTFLKTADELHQMKSANLEAAASNQVEARFPPFKSAEHPEIKAALKAAEPDSQIPPFFPFKSAEHLEVSTAVKATELDSQIPPFPFKSAEHPEMRAAMIATEMDSQIPPFFPFKSAENPEMSAAMKETESDSQVPPFFPFKSAEHPEMSAAMKATESDSQVPPFFPFKSAEHIETSAAIKATESDSQIPPFFPFKSAEHTETSAAVKATESDSQIPPFFPFKSAEHPEINTDMKATELDSQIPPFFPFKSAEHHEMKAVESDSQIPPFFPFKSAEHQDMSAATKTAAMNKMQQLHEPSSFRAEGKNWHMNNLNQKTSDMDFERIPQHDLLSHVVDSSFEPHLTKPTGSSSHRHMMPHHKSSAGIRFKAAEADSAVQATSQVNMNDAAGKSALQHNNLMQWKQKEAARYGAYGASAASGAGLSIGAGSAGGAGAVGVFPGAKVGGCAIPLLLSCSPSVVSGSLAAPSYSAPHSYRSANNFSGRFPIKRDTKKPNNISIKVKRTPSKVIQKIPLEKKL